MNSTHARIRELRLALIDARLDLHDAIREACPGPHVYLQTQATLPPWCSVCRYTDQGTPVDRQAAAEMGACSDG
jgi:hypothetical protein